MLYTRLRQLAAAVVHPARRLSLLIQERLSQRPSKATEQPESQQQLCTAGPAAGTLGHGVQLVGISPGCQVQRGLWACAYCTTQLSPVWV